MELQNNETTIHIKAVLNNEFRRFSMDRASFSQLEETIRSVYSLNPLEKLKICFVDDEKDNVVMSSDEEFRYAIDLVRPVRLVITLASGSKDPEANTCPVAAVTSCEPDITEVPGHFHHRRGGRGRFGNCRDEKHGWDEGKREKFAITREERIQRKTTKISERIKQVEALLQTDLPSHRERTLKWKLERLKSKLEKLELVATFSPECAPPTAIPTSETPELQHCRRGRGRGGRGGCRGRKAWDAEAGCEKKWGQVDDQIWQTLRTCRQNLRAAREAGNPEEIEKCTKALQEAQMQKWEAKHLAKEAKQAKCGTEEETGRDKFSEEKARKRECMKNLREAKASGDPEKIKAAQQAFVEAKEALQKAKVHSRC